MARAYTSTQRKQSGRQRKRWNRAMQQLQPAPWWLLEAVRRELEQRSKEQ